jgi:hypothetical protein
MCTATKFNNGRYGRVVSGATPPRQIGDSRAALSVALRDEYQGHVIAEERDVAATFASSTRAFLTRNKFGIHTSCQGAANVRASIRCSCKDA